MIGGLKITLARRGGPGYEFRHEDRFVHECLVVGSLTRP